jgi:hypothetical protein
MVKSALMVDPDEAGMAKYFREVLSLITVRA